MLAQAGATNFFAVWDHWLLDTLASWQKQAESSYAISMEDDRGVSPPPTAHEHQHQQVAGIKRERTVTNDAVETHDGHDPTAVLSSKSTADGDAVGVPLRKRKATESESHADQTASSI